MTTTAQIRFQGNIATLTLANAEARKPATLDEETLMAIGARLVEFAAWQVQNSGSTPLLVLRSAHERYFVVGADIAALEQLDLHTIPAWVEAGHRVFAALEAVGAPTLALVQGYALGGGLELAMACDFIWATPAAQFGQPEVKLGLPPGWGATLRLPRRVGMARAKEMLLSARMVDATSALSWGLVDRVGEADVLDAEVAELAATLAACSANAVAETKRLVQGGYTEMIERTLAAEAAASTRCITQEDTRARIGAFLAGRRPPAADRS
jgi:enoyl-CoA hydratase